MQAISLVVSGIMLGLKFGGILTLPALWSKMGKWRATARPLRAAADLGLELRHAVSQGPEPVAHHHLHKRPAPSPAHVLAALHLARVRALLPGREKGRATGRGAEGHDEKTPITLWPTRRACVACQLVKVRALVSAARGRGSSLC
jgi:hypothetical protein